MNRKTIGVLLDSTEKQIGGYERGSTSIPAFVIFTLEEETGIPAYRFYYEPLTRASFPIQPLSRQAKRETMDKETPPQYHIENLSLAERVRRLETKVFGV